MAKKRRSRRRGMLSGLTQKVKSLAGTAIQIAGVTVLVKPVIDAAVVANAAGGDIGQKLQSFSYETNNRYLKTADGVIAAVAGVVVIAIGSMVKRGLR